MNPYTGNKTYRSISRIQCMEGAEEQPCICGHTCGKKNYKNIAILLVLLGVGIVTSKK